MVSRTWTFWGTCTRHSLCKLPQTDPSCWSARYRSVPASLFGARRSFFEPRFRAESTHGRHPVGPARNYMRHSQFVGISVCQMEEAFSVEVRLPGRGGSVPISKSSFTVE